ncbi:hypothetical protein HDIA_0848 [Hartmannibacter diazotrophicus]|uniref:Uncharacterized protein n=1 Tax=Hartmannibacter diazotrophicus TaxID=1482074 RepID=A0A2C9D2I0_9HYPH|nr:hypothetical protein HDIA_0848 [Hartmannibacter diazotrophicus]
MARETVRDPCFLLRCSEICQVRGNNDPGNVIGKAGGKADERPRLLYV